jgi:hypothetical protein
MLQRPLRAPVYHWIVLKSADTSKVLPTAGGGGVAGRKTLLTIVVCITPIITFFDMND